MNDKLNSRITKTIFIHQLVATAFIKNPKKYKVVHHKDSNRSNNHYSNLEWTTQKKNTQYALAKKVVQFNMDGQFIKIFNSVSDCIKAINAKSYGIIAFACKGGYTNSKNILIPVKSAYGYKWKFYEDLTEEEKQSISTN
jgi:hypothetical protein